MPHTLEKLPQPRHNTSPLASDLQAQAKSTLAKIHEIIQSQSPEVLVSPSEITQLYAQTPQVHPDDIEIYELTKEILSLQTLDSTQEILESRLRLLMKEKGIKTLKHCEWPTVLDHIERGLTVIDQLDTTQERQRLYKIIFFAHDIGKTDGEIWVQNQGINASPNRGGNYVISFIWHADLSKLTPETHEMLQRYLDQSGLSQHNKDDALWIIQNHMNGGLIDVDSKLANSVKVYEERPEAFLMLLDVITIDGQATMTYSLDEWFWKNIKKSEIDQQKLLENIKAYQSVQALFSADIKIRLKQEQALNTFFNKVRNFDDIPDTELHELKTKIVQLADVESQWVEIPKALKRELGKILRADLKKFEEVYASLVSKKENQKACLWILQGKCGFTPEIALQVYEVITNTDLW